MTQKWEYKMFNDQIPGRNDHITTNFNEGSLNDLGKEGWELVTILHQQFITPVSGTKRSMLWIFKRPIDL